ncbi:MAG: hypothetical protein QXT05_03485 [Candidatus Bilamarchaeaceae archaeon]
MKLQYSNSEFEEKGNAEEEQSKRGRKKRLNEFCEKFWDTTKRTTQALGIAIGMGVLAYGCGKDHVTGDAETEEIEMVDVQDDDKIEEDTPNIETEDGDDVSNDNKPEEDANDEEVIGSNCPEPGAPLEGEVDPLIANTVNREIMLNGSDANVSGNIETTVGGQISGDILVLGSCPNDTNSIAAFGAQEHSIMITPEYRIDLTVNSAQLPQVDEPNKLCEPLPTDNLPVSIYSDVTKEAVKNARVGEVLSRGIFEFEGGLSQNIMVNESISSPVISFEEENYAKKLIEVAAPASVLSLSIKVKSKENVELLTKTVIGNLAEKRSRTLRVYQIGSGDIILPQVGWDTTPRYICTRSCVDFNAVTLTEVVVSGEITPPVNDECGAVFDGFDLQSVRVEIPFGGIPAEVARAYTVTISEANGVSTLGTQQPYFKVVVTRDPSQPMHDFGQSLGFLFRIRGLILSKDNNPKTGRQDGTEIDVFIEMQDPDVRDYPERCGCTPPGF